MDKAKLAEMINNNPNAIAHLEHPSDELKLLAVRKNGLALQYIQAPTRAMQEAAIEK